MSTECQPTRIALFLDGTWNTHSSDTNVHRLYKQADKSEYQIIKYFDGVGVNPHITEAISGALFAYGMTDIIRDAYKFLVNNYNPGDKVYLFGFSRGAFEVRVLIGFLHTCGLRDDISPVSINELWNYYESTQKDVKNKKTLGQLLQLSKEEQDKLEGIEKYLVEYCQPINIEFVGIFDVVAADPEADRHKYGQDPRKIGRIAHAIALDEHRGTFPVMMCEVPPPSEAARDVRGFVELPPDESDDEEDDKKAVHLIEQRWFIGAHSHVGGGMSETDLLSKIPLHWIQQRAAKAGLEFKRFIHLNGKEHLLCRSQVDVDKGQKLMQLFSFQYRTIGTDASINETIDKTVFERYQCKKLDYRPKNLENWARSLKLNLNDMEPNTLWADNGKAIKHNCREVTQTKKRQYCCHEATPSTQ